MIQMLKHGTKLSIRVYSAEGSILSILYLEKKQIWEINSTQPRLVCRFYMDDIRRYGSDIIATCRLLLVV